MAQQMEAFKDQQDLYDLLLENSAGGWINRINDHNVTTGV